MVLSGGYQEINAPTIADSIENLNAKFNLLKNIEKSNKMQKIVISDMYYY